MKTRKIGVTFDIDSNVYYGLKKLLNMDCKTLNHLFSACAINRMIEKGYLDEFGNPIELPQINIDFSEVNNVFSGIHSEEKK